MIKTKISSRLALAAALFCFAACGKKDDAASPQPILSAPNAIEQVPAQAEVKASSGPVELAFLLRETKVRVGEFLWLQLRMRNIGDKEIVVMDQAFHDPMQLAQSSYSRYGIYLEMIGPDGKPKEIEFSRPPSAPRDIMPGISGLLEVEGPEEQALLDGWKKRGLSLQEINQKLMDLNLKKQRAANAPQLAPFIRLQPGQSAETKYAFYYSMQDKIHNRPIPRPAGNFARLDFFVFDYPGTYKVRAVYDRLQSDAASDAGIPRYPHNVLIHSPWVSVQVLP